MELELRITGSTTPRQLQAAATLLLTLAGMEAEAPKATTAKANKTADTPAKNDTPTKGPESEDKALTLQDITERAQAYCGKDAVRKAKMRDVLDKLGAASLSKLKEAHYLSFITELETD